MPDRTVRIVLAAVLVLLALYVAQPYLQPLLYSADAPRARDGPRRSRAIRDLHDRAVRDGEPLRRARFLAGAAQNRDLFDLDDEGEAASRAARRPARASSGTAPATSSPTPMSCRTRRRAAVPCPCGLSDGEVVSATVVGMAPSYDLAVLRLGRLSHMPPPLAIGTSADLKVGQSTFAIGNPFGLDHTLTTGVISAVRRRMPTSEGRELSGVIQTDAAINPGNSGGPLLDSAGRLIGVNTAIVSPSGASAGIGFAIPVDVVNRIVPELIRAGRVRNPGIGIIAAQEAATARLGIDGVVILRVLPGSPAAQAGLRGVDPQTGDIGDVIVEANGRAVHRLADLTAALEEAGLGAGMTLKVARDGRIRQVRVTTADVAENRR